MLSKKSRLAALLCMAVAVSAFVPVHAHGPLPPLPLLKASSLAHHLLLRTPGLSGSQSAFLYQRRLITQTGISNGISQSLARALQQGPLTSGQINGTFYEAVSGTPPFFQYPMPQFIVALGSNPFSTNGFQGAATIPTTVMNQLSFAPTAITHGSIAAGLRIPPPYLSGSQRAFQNQLKLLAGNATALGQKIGNSQLSSPIVGGNFFGTGYFQFNTAAPPFVYGQHGIFDLAFGNNPLNVTTGGGLVNLNLASLRNYIQLANGKVYTYSSGLLFVSGYYPSGPYQGNRIFALGNDPLNFFNNYGAAPATVTYNTFPTSYLNF